jgi:hypothetical protein
VEITTDTCLKWMAVAERWEAQLDNCPGLSSEDRAEGLEEAHELCKLARESLCILRNRIEPADYKHAMQKLENLLARMKEDLRSRDTKDDVTGSLEDEIELDVTSPAEEPGTKRKGNK